MNKQYSKYGYAVKRQPEKKSRGWVWLGLLLVAVVSGFFVYQHQTTANASFGGLQFVSGMKTWFAKRHEHLQQGIIKSKHRVTEAAVEEVPPIHFEFYKALPNSQVPLPEARVEKEAKVSAPKKKVEIANADELEQELSEAANQTHDDN